MRVVLFLALLVASTAARADSWLPAQTKVYEAPDHSARLTVVPGKLTSALDYFSDKVAGKEPAGAPPGSVTGSAIAKLEVRTASGVWVTKWSRPLANEVAPVEVIVAPGGKALATFDNWHSMGLGPDGIVIYNENGEVTKQFALGSIFPDWFVDTLPRSVSSIWWRGDPRLSNDSAEVIVPVTLPSIDRTAGQDGPALDLHIRLADAEVLGLGDTIWRDALRNAAKVARAQCADELAYAKLWNGPVSAPLQWDEMAWSHYLNEVGFRLVPGAMINDGPVVGSTVLPPSTASNFRASLEGLKQALTQKPYLPGSDIRIIGSPEPLNLAARINEFAPRMKPQRLVGVQFIFIADASTGQSIKSALARSGTAVRIVAPDEQIPQLPDRMDNTPESERPVYHAPVG